MADSAALKLGNVISGQISGALGNFASGVKGSFVSANPAVFAPMLGALSKGFGSLNVQSQKESRAQIEESQRAAGFAEERGNEQKRYEQILLSVQKGMAINIDLIQKDVRAILELMKESAWDKLKGMLAGLAALPQKLPEVFKKIPESFRNVFKGIKIFFEKFKLPNFEGIRDFFKRFRFPDLRDFFRLKFPKIGNFFKKIGDFFDKIKFPETGAFLRNLFERFKKAFRFDDLKNIFKFDNLKGMFKLDGLKNGIGGLFKTLANEFDLLRLRLLVEFKNLKTTVSESISKAGKAITESDFVRGIQNLFTDVKGKFVSIGDSLNNLRIGILDSLGNAVRVFKESNLGQAFISLGDDLGRVVRTISAPLITLGEAIGRDIAQIRDSFRTATGAADAAQDAAKVGDVADTLRDADKIKDAVKSVGIFGGILGKIGDIGNVIGDMVKGPLKMFGELTDVGPFLKGIGKVLGPIGVIISIFDGISLAVDTEKLQKYFGKEDIGMQERISAFIGGFIGGFGGLIDLLAGAMGFEGTNFQETMSKDITLGINKVFDGIKAVFMFIGDIIRSKAAQDVFAALKETGSKMFDGLSKLFNFIKDFFMSDAMQSVFGLIGGLVGESIKNAVKVLGSIVELIVGIFTFDASLISKAGKDIWGTVVTGLSNSFRMIGNVIEEALTWVYNKIFGWWKTGSDKPVAATDATGMARNVEFETESPASSSGAAPSPASPRTGNASPMSAEAQRLVNVPGASRGTSVATTEQDLVAMGLKIKPGKTQVAGRGLSPLTIESAKWLQFHSGFPIERFTGFNDGHPREKSNQDSHSKGLAFDFTIPQNLATNDNFRKSLAKAISDATGAYVVDEYAIKTANWTGGHFHVDFTRASGVDLGTGVYAGFNWKDAPDISSMDIRLSRMPAPVSAPSSISDSDVNVSGDLGGTASIDISGPSSASTFGLDASKIAPPLLKTAIATQTSAQLQAQQLQEQRKRHEEDARREKSYEDERKRLEREFHNEMKGIFRPIVESLKGPNNTPEAMVNAGKNISKFLRDDFEKLGVTIFGKQYGAAIGETFQKLAGVYLNQFITESLAPALGMNAGILNRAINTYVKGVETLDPKLKEANASLAKSRETLDKFVKEKGEITQADIIRAAGRGGFTADQKQRLSQLTALREDVARKEAAANALKAQKKEYQQAALEDMIFGMTGVSLGPRTMLDQYAGGAAGLTEDLATFFGAPFKPAFGLGDQDAVAYKKLQAESALYQQHVQGQSQIYRSHLEGQQQVNSQFISAYAQVAQGGASAMQTAVQNAIRTGSSYASDMAGGSADLIGGGTAIPGYTGPSYVASGANVDEYGIPIQGPMNFFGQKSGQSAVQGRLMDFGQNLAFNFLGGKLAKSFGGGMSGNILGKISTGALKGAFTGKGTIAQNIGSQFGLQLGPNVGITDALGGIFNSFNPVSGIAKGGMNLMQQLMPGGATGPLGQMGFDFFSGMGSSGNFLGNLGSQLGMTQGAGFAGMSGSQIAGQALGSLGTGFAAYGLSKALSGGYDLKGVNAIAGIASMIPGVGMIAAPIGALVNRAFGRKAKKMTGQGIQGTLTTEGVQNLQNYSDWFQKGGWFRSDKRGRDYTAASSETVSAFNEILTGTAKTVKDLGKVLGFDQSRVSGFSKAMNISLTGMNEEQQRAAIEKAFKDYGSELVGHSFKYVTRVQRSGEDSLQTLEELAKVSQVFASAFTTLNVEKLLGIDTAGGMRNFASSKGLAVIQGVADEIVGSFAGALSDNAKELNELISTYTADFQRSLLEAYGGEEQFKKVEETLFNVLYTPQQKLEIMQQKSLQRMQENARALEDAGGAISPDKVAELAKLPFEDTQKFIQAMLADAEAVFDPNNPQSIKNLADIRTAAANFLSAAQSQNSSADQLKELVEGQAEKIPLVFDANKYIPILDALGNALSPSPVYRPAVEPRTGLSTVSTAQDSKRTAIAGYYQQYLGRTGSASEIDWWVNNTSSLEEARSGISGSPEARSYSAGSGFDAGLGRARGGSFNSGSPMLVGEVGPELLIPNFVGTVVPTNKIIEAVQNASSLDSQTRNLLTMASPTANPVTQVFLDQQDANRTLTNDQSAYSVTSALVDNSVTSVSSPRTNIINRGDDVRSTHPVAGVFTRAITAARM